MSLGLEIPLAAAITNKKTAKDRFLGFQVSFTRSLMFWPLIVAGGRLVFRVVFNLWDMIES